LSVRTSLRAKLALAIMLFGYLALAIVAGAPNSPLTVLLPSGASPPSWATGSARALGLDDVGRNELTALAWIFVVVVLASFAVTIAEAWLRRVRLATVLVASGVSLLISVAAPLLLSRDVYTYAAYGRIEALYHRNPYVTTLSSFPHDPFVAVSSAQWLHTHSHYGTLFTLVSAGIARASAGSPAGTILAFKLLAGVAIAVATVCVALAVAKTRPERASLAVALVGLNPVLIVHTVGGAHIDALVAALLAAALALAVTNPRAASGRSIGVTVLLTLACLIKIVIVPALVLWFVWLARSERRLRILATHLLLAVGVVLASLVPYRSGWHTFASFTTLGGVEAWASPSHLVGHALGAAGIVNGVFLLVFLALLVRLAQRKQPPIETWGIALLLLALSLPYLLPWYAAWFLPFLVFVDDAVFTFAGAFASGVLALTLIPADPFHGLTTPAVMDGVHYGAAAVLLVVLVVVAWRVVGLRSRRLVPSASPLFR
jgi:hypothetical protein